MYEIYQCTEENVPQVVSHLMKNFNISTPLSVIITKFKNQFRISKGIYEFGTNQIMDWFFEIEVGETLNSLMQEDSIDVTVDDNGEFLFYIKK